MVGMPGRTSINMYLCNRRRIVLVEGVCEDSGDSQVGMILDEVHRCDLGLELLGVAWRRCGGLLDLDPGRPATPVGELKQANDVVEARL